MAVSEGRYQRCITFDQGVNDELERLHVELEVSVSALVREAVRLSLPKLRARARVASTGRRALLEA